MQEQRYDGTEKITRNASEEDFRRALQNAENRTVTAHKPGSVITTMVKGHRQAFRVEEGGGLTRVHLVTHEPVGAIGAAVLP